MKYVVVSDMYRRSLNLDVSHNYKLIPLIHLSCNQLKNHIRGMRREILALAKP